MSILRVRDVRLIVGAVGLSAAGDTVLWVLLALHIGATAGSALAVSAMFVCLWGPVVALGGLAGRIVDRYENRRLLIGVSLAQAAAVAGMAFASGSLPALLVLCALLGAGVAVSSPAEFALVPAAAGEKRIAEANGHVEAARYLGMTAGPVLGGVLAAAGMTRAGLLLNAASFLAVAAAGLALHARRAPAPAPATATGERGGLQVAFADRTLAIALTAAIASLLFFTMSVAAEVFFARDVLGAGATGYGVLMTAWTLGMVAGAVGLARRVPSAWLAAAALAGGVLVGVAGAQVALALSGAIPLAIGLAAFALLARRVPASTTTTGRTAYAHGQG
jgi:MFS family permease